MICFTFSSTAMRASPRILRNLGLPLRGSVATLRLPTIQARAGIRQPLRDSLRVAPNLQVYRSAWEGVKPRQNKQIADGEAERAGVGILPRYAQSRSVYLAKRQSGGNMQAWVAGVVAALV